MITADNYDLEMVIAADFAWSMIDGRSREMLQIVLVEQLAKLLRGNRGKGDMPYRRRLLFDGIRELGRAGLPIGISSELGIA